MRAIFHPLKSRQLTHQTCVPYNRGLEVLLRSHPPLGAQSGVASSGNTIENIRPARQTSLLTRARGRGRLYSQ